MQETNLARLRKFAGLTQAQLSEKSGVPTQTIGGLECRRRSIGGISLRIACRLATSLGVHAEELLDEEP